MLMLTVYDCQNQWLKSLPAMRPLPMSENFNVYKSR